MVEHTVRVIVIPTQGSRGTSDGRGRISSRRKKLNGRNSANSACFGIGSLSRVSQWSAESALDKWRRGGNSLFFFLFFVFPPLFFFSFLFSSFLVRGSPRNNHPSLSGALARATMKCTYKRSAARKPGAYGCRREENTERHGIYLDGGEPRVRGSMHCSFRSVPRGRLACSCPSSLRSPRTLVAGEQKEREREREREKERSQHWVRLSTSCALYRA